MPFCVALAKSDHAVCKHCDKHIPQGSVKIATAFHYGGTGYTGHVWNHLKCFNAGQWRNVHGRVQEVQQDAMELDGHVMSDEVALEQVLEGLGDLDDEHKERIYKAKARVIKDPAATPEAERIARQLANDAKAAQERYMADIEARADSVMARINAPVRTSARLAASAVSRVASADTRRSITSPKRQEQLTTTSSGISDGYKTDVSNLH